MSGLATYFADQADLLAIDIRVLNALLESKQFHPDTLATIAMARTALETARKYLLRSAASELPPRAELPPLTKESAK